MGDQTIRVISPSGGRVELAWSDEAPLTSLAMGIRFAGSTYGRGFQIGPRGHHDFAARYLLPATLRERLVVRNREVLVSEADDGSATIATLLGEHHELMTVFGGPGPGRTALSDLFGTLDIHDEPEGMRVAPRSASLLTVLSEQIVAVTETRGSINVPSPPQAKTLVPTWRGAKTTHGEVWRSLLPDASRRSEAPRARDYAYVIGCAKGAAEVHLEPEGAISDDELLQWVDSIRVTWLNVDAQSRR